MKKQLSDEQLDQMMRQLLSDATLDEASINEVTDSPTLWWAVQRKINREKEVSVEPWPPIAKFWRWLILGVPAATAAVVLAVLFAFQPSRVDTDDLALTVAKVSDEAVSVQPDINPAVNNAVDTLPAKIDSISTKSVNQSPTAGKFVAAKHIENKLTPVNRGPRTITVARKAAEIKTDFIALSYARNPDSGQIVRVRVPSSMMVTLGLVDSVEKPSNLVDAEVLVGDDGLTRAIRFIR